MSNHPMNTPTISELSETLHTASPLPAYSILKLQLISLDAFREIQL